VYPPSCVRPRRIVRKAVMPLFGPTHFVCSFIAHALGTRGSTVVAT
jgi:hypothetical protein